MESELEVLGPLVECLEDGARRGLDDGHRGVGPREVVNGGQGRPESEHGDLDLVVPPATHDERAPVPGDCDGAPGATACLEMRQIVVGPCVAVARAVHERTMEHGEVGIAVVSIPARYPCCT